PSPLRSFPTRRSSDLLYFGGKTVVVAGYGWCGKGLARRASALNALVVICEVDPVRALEAVADGFSVMPLEEAAAVGDFFVTSTGDRKSTRLNSSHVKI